MRKHQTRDSFKIIGATVLTLSLAAASFLDINNIAFAAATQPELLSSADLETDMTVENVVPEAKINIIVQFDPNPDENGVPYPNNVPDTNAMPYEEAAQIGAQYIKDMTGQSIEGMAVEMMYSAWPHSSRPYWHGEVALTTEDLNLEPTAAQIAEGLANAEEGATLAAIPGYERKVLYDFSIDAVTGDRVSLHPHYDIPEPTNLGEGTVYNLSPVQMEALQYEAPANVDEYAEVAQAYAQKHFNHSTVADVKFVSRSINHGTREQSNEHYKAYKEAYNTDKNAPFTFTLYERGNIIEFDVTDDTGRVARVSVHMDTKQAISLDTSGSDFIPGYNFESEEGVG